jgi:ABC-type multidrug transport system permease subunit
MSEFKRSFHFDRSTLRVGKWLYYVLPILAIAALILGAIILWSGKGE